MEYDTCAPCGRPMRRSAEPAADHPGTVARQRDGLCQSCARGHVPRSDRDPLTALLLHTGAALPADERGLCAETDPEVFYEPDGHGQSGLKHERIKAAKTICGQCPIRQACLDVAIANREQSGVWGGLTPEERGVRTKALRMAESRERVAS